MWGGTTERNMVAPNAKNIPSDFTPGEIDDEERVDMATTKNVKWVAKLGSQAYGNPVIIGGRVYVGTNNESPRDPRFKGDRSAVYCLDEKTGKLIWQYIAPKLGAGKVSDWEFLGICSTVAVEGERVYLVSNRCEIVCLDVNGLANGNQGFADEAKYMAGPGKPPITPGANDADIIWVYDMRDELGVFPHNIASNSPLVFGDNVYVATSNGVDWSHTNIPSPRAPALIALDKKTGKLVGEEASGVSRRMLHCNWSSPAVAVIADQPQLIWGGGDGWCYGLNTRPEKDADGYGILKELWRVDCNPPHYRNDKDGKPIKYATPPGPSECIGTAVVHGQRVYIGIGQDPEHGEGVGNFVCIDPTKRGDITQSGVVWSYDKINRTISTASVADGLVYIVDYSGVIHCLDAKTGKPYWTLPMDAHVWGSTYIADGKLFVGNELGELYILQHGKQLKKLNMIEFDSPIYSTPVVANGVLYIATQTHLYAVEAK